MIVKKVGYLLLIRLKLFKVMAKLSYSCLDLVLWLFWHLSFSSSTCFISKKSTPFKNLRLQRVLMKCFPTKVLWSWTTSSWGQESSISRSLEEWRTNACCWPFPKKMRIQMKSKISFKRSQWDHITRKASFYSVIVPFKLWRNFLSGISTRKKMWSFHLGSSEWG